MGRLLIKWLCLTGAVLFAAYVLDGIYVKDFFSAFFTAAVLGILNMFFRPVLFILTLPINVMTLGFFTFVINALMLKMASGLISGFTVTGFWTAIFGALLISIANWVLTAMIQENRMYEDSRPQPQRPEQDDDTIDLDKFDDKWE
ncbi:MAG: phage holin family protein [Desulfobacteraceae bacterium]|nr:phage holin family protein [Desulfobacteraceae bacterium]MBC2755993.1 phage holin family protein [Desulfobacteraceae bacterium]